MKGFAISVIAIIILAISAFTIINKPQPSQIPQIASSTPLVQDEKVDIKASFTIITDNIIRSFKAEKYHNLSPDVYIEASDPTVIHVKKAGITWDDFFKTLPMKLTEDCLTTGDGETFCDGKNGSLRVYLNDKEDKDLLDRQIKDGDKALIKFIYI